MVADIQMIKPKKAHRGQQSAFVRNPCWQNKVESTDAVGTDDQQCVAQVIDVAYLATSLRKWQLRSQQGSGIVKLVEVARGGVGLVHLLRLRSR